MTDLFLDKMERRLCDGDFSFLPMPLVFSVKDQSKLAKSLLVGNQSFYCLTKIYMRAKCSISRVFFLFIVPSPFFVYCPYKGCINRAESVLTGLKPY